ncbi:hypothetical protein [Embleya sp. AB8]|uniref:hypothetical protein n=1 Tax=Embleya sp. AB8 TaxID=3156304 RepID=UPI003C71A590
MLAELLPKQQADDIRVGLAGRKEALTQECMSGKGFRYYPQPVGSLLDLHGSVDPTSIADARSRGFGVTSIPQFQKQAPDNDTYYKSLPQQRRQDYSSALSACVTSAGRGANSEQGLDAAQSLYARIEGKVEKTKEYRDALTTWASCSAEAGYPGYSSRDDLVGRLAKRRQDIARKPSTGNGVMDANSMTGLQHDPDFARLHDDEVAAAVATFPCSQAMTAVRARLITGLLST